MFVTMVSKHRNLSAAVYARRRRGSIFGPDAIGAGLADQLGTLPQAITALGDLVSGPSSIGIMNTPITGQTEPLAPTTQQQPQTLPTAEQIAQAVQAATGDATVVRLDAVREANANLRREHAEIVAQCNNARMPDLAEQYIKAETPLHAVRADLQRRRAEADEARQVETVDTTQRPAVVSGPSELIESPGRAMGEPDGQNLIGRPRHGPDC